MENTATDQKRSQLWWLGIAIPLIPLIGALGYLLAYVYERRFCNAFGIPTEFIVINWNSIIIASVAIVVFAISVIALLFGPVLLYQMGFAKPHRPIVFKIVKYFGMLLRAIFIYIRYHDFEKGLWLLLIFPH